MQTKLLTELEKIQNFDFTKKFNDGKERKNQFDFYQKSKKFNEKNAMKQYKIDVSLEKIVTKMKTLLICDESKWKSWKPKDFQKFVLRKKILVSFRNCESAFEETSVFKLCFVLNFVAIVKV